MANNEAMMYPGTDYPKYREEFETLDELIETVNAMDEGLNLIVSWIVGCRQCDMIEDPEAGGLMWDGNEANFFSILIFMPRKTETTEFQVNFGRESFPHVEVDNWLLDHVYPRIMRWYGWTWIDAQG